MYWEPFYYYLMPEEVSKRIEGQGLRIRLSEVLSDVGLSADADAYYSFGGYRGKSLLVVMPSYQAVYYLYRD